MALVSKNKITFGLKELLWSQNRPNSKRQNIQKASKPFGDITEPTKQTKTSQIQKIEPIQKQIELIPQKSTISHTVESFNNLSLTDQLSTISNITDQSQQQMSIHSILSILHEMNPTGGSHYLSLQTKDNKMPLNAGISLVSTIIRPPASKRSSEKYSKVLPYVESR